MLAEEFERAFGCRAKFSFDRNGEHGRRLLAILDRLDRYRCGDGPPALWLLRRCIQIAGGSYAEGHVHSLAYFLPFFGELARLRRRKYKLYWKLSDRVSAEGIPAWL